MKLLHSGKVRDVYSDGDDLILVASDRVSVFDTVLPTPIPDKGKILTQLSLWWFEQVADLVPHHVISATDVPEEFTGRAIRCRSLDIVPVECVARGYLSGSAWAAYRTNGTISGVRLPDGLRESDRLPEPIFTPTTKAPAGQGHDEPMTFEEVVKQEGPETAERLRELTLAIYARGAEIARERDLLVADTKLEFGRDASGRLVLADELFTPDSSRFWRAADWEPGRPQDGIDKQYVRDWAASSGWDRTGPPPELPAEVVAETRRRYVEIYERLTGTSWSGSS